MCMRKLLLLKYKSRQRDPSLGGVVIHPPHRKVGFGAGRCPIGCTVSDAASQGMAITESWDMAACGD
jgi:hypothetical protein